MPFLKDAYDLSDKSDEWVRHLALIYKNHISYGKQIVDEVSLFFEEDICLSAECLEFMSSEGIDTTISAFRDEIFTIAQASPIFTC